MALPDTMELNNCTIGTVLPEDGMWMPPPKPPATLFTMVLLSMRATLEPPIQPTLMAPPSPSLVLPVKVLLLMLKSSDERNAPPLAPLRLPANVQLRTVIVPLKTARAMPPPSPPTVLWARLPEMVLLLIVSADAAMPPPPHTLPWHADENTWLPERVLRSMVSAPYDATPPPLCPNSPSRTVLLAMVLRSMVITPLGEL